MEGANTHVEPASSSSSSRRDVPALHDVTIVHVSVDDVDEPPVFDAPAYLVDVAEDAEVGTLVRTLGARDPDSDNNTVR